LVFRDFKDTKVSKELTDQPGVKEHKAVPVRVLKGQQGLREFKVPKEMLGLRGLKATQVTKVPPAAALKVYRVMWVIRERMLLQLHKDLSELQATRETPEQGVLLAHKVRKELEELKALQDQVPAALKDLKVHRDIPEQMGLARKALQAQQGHKVQQGFLPQTVHKVHKEIQGRLLPVLREPKGQPAQFLVLQVLKDYREAKDHRVLPVLVELRVILFQVRKEIKEIQEVKV
jgi:hypothetical protein